MNIGIKTTAPERAIWICALGFWLIRLNSYLIGGSSNSLCATEKVLSPGSVQKIRIKWSRPCRRSCSGWYVSWLSVGWLCVGWLIIRWSWMEIADGLLRLRIDFSTNVSTGVLIIWVLWTHTLSCEQMNFPWCPHCHFRSFCWCHSCRSCQHFSGCWWHDNVVGFRTRLDQFWSITVNDFKNVSQIFYIYQ